MPSILSTLQQYAPYESGASQIVVIRNNSNSSENNYSRKTGNSFPISQSSNIDNIKKEFQVLHMV
jgi:hypothetical protein